MANSDEDLESRCQAAAYRAQRFHDWFKPLLRASKASENAYATKDRLKKASEIKAKVIAKRGHEDEALRKPDYDVSDVTDASGFRVVCLFNAEIPTALGQIFDLIEAQDGSTSYGRFCAKPVREVIFYSSRRPGDPLSILHDVRATVESHGHKLKDDGGDGSSASSYSSVHVVVEGEITEQGAEPVTSCSEIQVRSVFEEAWGEINHRLKYAPAKRQRALGRIAGRRPLNPGRP